MLSAKIKCIQAFMYRALYFVYTLSILGVSLQIFMKVPNINFHRNLPSWSSPAICRQMDGHDGANSCFSQLGECT